LLDAARILENARKPAPKVAARAEEIARLRRLPADLVAGLEGAGVFPMPLPAAWGGPETSPRALNEVVEILSSADASLGWCVTIGSDAGFYSAFPEEAAARVLRHLTVQERPTQRVAALAVGEAPDVPFL
jgi:alkylation response protein AidB-like acyl-CoA dehydrogenase